IEQFVPAAVANAIEKKVNERQ
ncbi:pantetheine-phosphate adenylyltransferase, partial [Vibrio sp. 1833]|nr:pantetheine-phosphate adenylyltransferase [Vibrio sp. 1833]